MHSRSIRWRSTTKSLPTSDDTPSGAPPIATLLAISGPLTGMRLELADETRVGRSEENDLILPDALVSRLHALIRRRNLSWIVEDLESRHGTFLNRRRIEGSRPVLRNDELQSGQSRCLFDSEVDVQNAVFSDRLVFLGT
ncbi:MAG: FHA domain-containing protein, partial [FCB group bacterium]|nr:FHA domain-containing protein [FCB group bacterium]